jgi:hypothetical protein
MCILHPPTFPLSLTSKYSPQHCVLSVSPPVGRETQLYTHAHTKYSPQCRFTDHWSNHHLIHAFM